MKLSKLVETEYENISSEHIALLKKSDRNVVQEIRTLWIKTTEIFCKDLQKFLYNNDNDNFDDYYNLFAEKLRLKKIRYNPEDITAFCFSLDEKDRSHIEYAGYVLSALVNHHASITDNETEYLLFLDNLTCHLDNYLYQLDFLCYANIANVHIKGNAGSFLCSSMRNGIVEFEKNAGDNIHSNAEIANVSGGRILVKGDVYGNIGTYMTGGEIIVLGNVYDGDVGTDMCNGKITIKGDAKYENVFGEVGMDMTGGEIYLEGNNWNVSSSIQAGTVYQNGKRIFPEEK